MSKTAKCERTGEVVKIIDGFFTYNVYSGEWNFLSTAAPDDASDYNIDVERMMKSPSALVDCIAHLSEKTWFSADKFVAFFCKFRKDNNLYSSF